MPTLRIRDVETATPRAMLVHVELGDHGFDYAAGQAVLVAPHGVTPRRPYSIASAPEDAKRSGIVDLLIGIDGGDGEAAFEAAAGAIDFRQTVTRGGGTAWTGPRGRLTIDTLRDLAVDVETLCFVCGPASMVVDVPTLLQQAGVPRGRIRSEEWQQAG